MDIVERLRSDAEDIGLLKTEETDRIRQKYKVYGTMVEAADEIEGLRKEIELLHSIVANVRKTVRDGLYKYEMEKNPTGVKNIKWEEE